MEQNQAIEKARRFAQTAYAGEADGIARQYQMRLDAERAQLAARGLAASSSMVVATVGIECDRIRALIQLRLNSFLEGCELYHVSINDELAASVGEEVLKEMNSLIDSAQRNFFVGVPAVSQTLYPQLMAKQIGNAPAWIQTQVERRRLMSKKSESSTTIYNVQGENARVNVNSNDHSVNVVTKSKEEFFTALQQRIESGLPEGQERQRILSALTALQESHGTRSFVELYTDFIAAAANHVALLTPFLPALTEMIHNALK